MVNLIALGILDFSNAVVLLVIEVLLLHFPFHLLELLVIVFKLLFLSEVLDVLPSLSLVGFHTALEE